MTVIELRTMEIIGSYLPKITSELKRIADIYEAESHIKLKCCICGKKISGYGNDPWPLDKREGAKCCDKCNEAVIEARLEHARIKEEVENG